MKIAVYMRVSTDRQTTDSQSNDIVRYINMHFPDADVELFEDVGVSGSKAERVALAMLTHRLHEFDKLIIYKLDRLFRSLRHMIEFTQKLETHNVALVSVKDNIDLATPAGRLLFHILSALGEFEREVIRERVKSGLAATKAKGTKLGRKPTVFDLEQARRLQANGLTYDMIARVMGRSKGKIYYALNPSDEATLDN